MFKSNKGRFNQFEQDRLLALFNHAFHAESGLPGFRKKGFCVLNRDALGDTFDKLFGELTENQKGGKFETKYDTDTQNLTQIQALLKVLGGTIQEYECAVQDYVGTRVLKAMNCDVAYDIPVMLYDEEEYPQFYILSVDFLKKHEKFEELGALRFYGNNMQNTLFELVANQPKLFSTLCLHGAKVDSACVQKMSDEFVRQYLVRLLVLMDYDADFKNFGLIFSSDKTPRCAPAFDLEFALSIPGETSNFYETITESLENARTKKILQSVVNDANKNLLDGTFEKILKDSRALELYPDCWSEKSKAEDEYGIERDLYRSILWLNEAVLGKLDISADYQQIADYVNGFLDSHRKSKELQKAKFDNKSSDSDGQQNGESEVVGGDKKSKSSIEILNLANYIKGYKSRHEKLSEPEDGKETS